MLSVLISFNEVAVRLLAPLALPLGVDGGGIDGITASFKRKTGDFCTKPLYTAYRAFVQSVQNLCTLLTVLCFSWPSPFREKYRLKFHKESFKFVTCIIFLSHRTINFSLLRFWLLLLQ